mgnify:CR=1 FL=1
MTHKAKCWWSEDVREARWLGSLMSRLNSMRLAQDPASHLTLDFTDYNGRISLIARRKYARPR